MNEIFKEMLTVQYNVVTDLVRDITVGVVCVRDITVGVVCACVLSCICDTHTESE